MTQDQTCYFNYLIARKIYTVFYDRLSLDKILLFFHDRL